MQIISKNTSIGYNNIPLHTNINFTIHKGDYICVVGENGAGKSTLIKSILGLIPTVEGKISIGDGLNSKDIGYLPQQSQIQKDFPASVYEVCLSGCLNKMGLRPFYNQKEKQLAKDMLKKLGISDLEKKSFSTLSGGQKQRVLLARALCATNKILLLDEPTAGLDVNTTNEFYKLINTLNNEGVTIIIITHNLNEIIEDAKYILSVNKDSVLYQDVKCYKENSICLKH